MPCAFGEVNLFYPYLLELFPLEGKNPLPEAGIRDLGLGDFLVFTAGCFLTSSIAVAGGRSSSMSSIGFLLSASAKFLFESEKLTVLPQSSSFRPEIFVDEATKAFAPLLTG